VPRSVGLTAKASASRQARGEKLEFPTGTAESAFASQRSGVIAQVKAGSNPFVSESARHAAGSLHSTETAGPARDRAIRVAWASKAVTRAVPPDHGSGWSAPCADAAHTNAMSDAATERRMA